MLVVQLDALIAPSHSMLLEQAVEDKAGFEGFVSCSVPNQQTNLESASAAEYVNSLQQRFEALQQHFSPSRASAWQKLVSLEVEQYAHTRNHLEGGVTQLSAFIESGLITEAEILAYLQATLGQNWSSAYRFVQQLSWREFFQQKWRRDFMAPVQAQQDYKTGWRDQDYQTQMPAFIEQANTDSALMNQLIIELQSTGYLHNHGRLYLASYVVHWCRVHWKTGAEWMLQYLIDGNLASNHFSWQWVASTHSPKPYIFNLENAQRFCGSQYNTTAVDNPSLAATYEQLQQRLFPNSEMVQK